MRRIDRPTVTIDLSRVQANAEAIAKRTGVPLIAVVKADAYGLGALRVVRALGDLASAYYVFDAVEAVTYRDAGTDKPTITLLGASNDVEDYVSHRIRPAVWTAERAIAMRKARPVLSVDTGQQRFGIPASEVDEVLKTGVCEEAFTHASTLAQAELLRTSVGGRVGTIHAAGSALIEQSAAWLDAVRPGLSLYIGAVRVTAPLLEARDVHGPAGYGQFTAATGRLGIIAGGYSNGMKAGGPCVVGGKRQRIPEIGMQSAFVEIGPGDKAGDEITLLGDGIGLQDVAAAWGTSPHEALFRLCGVGDRVYRGG